MRSSIPTLACQERQWITLFVSSINWIKKFSNTFITVLLRSYQELVVLLKKRGKGCAKIFNISINITRSTQDIHKLLPIRSKLHSDLHFNPQINKISKWQGNYNLVLKIESKSLLSRTKMANINSGKQVKCYNSYTKLPALKFERRLLFFNL